MNKFEDIQNMIENKSSWEDVAIKYKYASANSAQASFIQWQKRIKRQNMDELDLKNRKKRNTKQHKESKKRVEMKLDDISKEWIKESEKHNFTVYTLKIDDEKLYIGYTGDLPARVYHHMSSKFKNRKIQIISCEFFFTKNSKYEDSAEEREKELIYWHWQNGDNLENILIANTYYSFNPKSPQPGVCIGENGYSVLSYIGFMEWLKENLDLPFAKSTYNRCEGSSYHPDRKIVREVIDLINYYYAN